MEHYLQLRFFTDSDGSFVPGSEMAAVNEFLTLCASSDAAKIQKALDGGASVQWHGADGETPLMAASRFNKDPRAAAVLLRAGADVNEQDAAGMSALMKAAKAGSAAVTDELIEAGAKVALRDADGRTALMYAAAYSRSGETLDILLRSGADPLAADRNGMTALMYAVKQSLPEGRIVRLLLLAGSDPSAADISGWSPLRLAAAYNAGPETTEQLIASGAKLPQNENDTLLFTQALMQNPLMDERKKTALAEKLFRPRHR
jgi:ankyrin repeat protein